MNTAKKVLLLSVTMAVCASFTVVGKPRLWPRWQGPSQEIRGPRRFASSSEVAGEDMLTPAYYLAGKDNLIKGEIDRFLEAVRRVTFHNPLAIPSGRPPDYSVPVFGRFGASKGRTGKSSSHPATDLRVGKGETDVNIYAAHDGIVHTVRNATKYRQYVSITKTIKDKKHNVIGKLVTLYGHVDLDLDEAGSLRMDGQRVRKGDLISRHLYADTRGGPHLHFEIRYYRKDDTGTETFYGGSSVAGAPEKARPSAGPWTLGYWDPDVGYGFGHPEHHGLTLQRKTR